MHLPGELLRVGAGVAAHAVEERAREPFEAFDVCGVDLPGQCDDDRFAFARVAQQCGKLRVRDRVRVDAQLDAARPVQVGEHAQDGVVGPAVWGLMVMVDEVLDAQRAPEFARTLDGARDVLRDRRDHAYLAVGAVELVAFLVGADGAVAVDLVGAAHEVAERRVVAVVVLDHVVHRRRDPGLYIGPGHVHRVAVVVERARLDRAAHALTHVLLLLLLLCLPCHDDDLTRRGPVRGVDVVPDERVGLDEHADVVVQVGVALVEQQ